MITVFIRSIILYIAVLIALRAMGKSELSEMNSFELVITLLIAEVAAIPMEDNRIPLTYGIAAISGLVFIQISTSFITTKSTFFRSIVSGNPSVLINNGQIDYKNLKKESVTIEELLEALRIQGYFSLNDVKYAILETDGNLSILPSKDQNEEEVNIKHLPIGVVYEGKIIKRNLKLVNKSEDWLIEKLKRKNINEYKNILICMIDEQDNLIIQMKDNKF